MKLVVKNMFTRFPRWFLEVFRHLQQQKYYWTFQKSFLYNTVEVYDCMRTNTYRSIFATCCRVTK